jgi:hypothetical protein
VPRGIRARGLDNDSQRTDSLFGLRLARNLENVDVARLPPVGHARDPRTLEVERYLPSKRARTLTRSSRTAAFSQDMKPYSSEGGRTSRGRTRAEVGHVVARTS